MKHILLYLLLGIFCLSAAEPVIERWQGEAFQLDGRLTEPAWNMGSIHKDFTPPEFLRQKKVELETSFRMRYDSDYLYVGIDCVEPRMKDLNPNAVIWTGDGVEVFFCPSGKADEYYQFRTNAMGPVYAMYYAESGTIRPDPYAPDWQSCVHRRNDGWSVEMKIPWNAFYLTSARKWSSRWRVNVARERRIVRQEMSWSPLRSAFNESDKFRFMCGFPLKKREDDLYVKNVLARIQHMSGGRYRGELELEISSALAANLDMVLETPGKICRPLQLKSGTNYIRIPDAEFSKAGRNRCRIRLYNTEKHLTASRYYDVAVAFTPLKIHFTSPEYRSNFYPDQDSSSICGTAEINVTDAEKLLIHFNGRQVAALPVTASLMNFSFPTPNLPDGRHTVSFKLIMKNSPAVEVQKQIEKFSSVPPGIKASWITNGHIVYNGRPMIPRVMFAHYWHGGKALQEKTDADDLGLTDVERNLRSVVIPTRFIPDIEAREATRDITPSPELFKKMKRYIDYRDKNFLFYYMCDEPECRNISAVYLSHIYQYLCKIDPWHVVFVSSREAPRFAECADLLIPHPYIGPTFDGKGKRFLNVPVHQIRDYLNAVNRLNRKDKVTGLTGQFFSYKMNSIFADYPTFAELEVQVWTALANNAQFFNNYAYHDLGDRPVLYEGTRFLMTSVRALEDFYCSASRLPLEVHDPDRRLDALFLQSGKDYLLLLVNLKPEIQKTTIQSSLLARTALWHRFRENEQLQGGRPRMDFTLNPYQCLILTSRKMDAGLPTRKETLDKIQILERLRLSRPSILLQRGLDIDINSSNQPRSPLSMQNKLFDGTLDVWAWEHSNKKTQPFLELSFPAFTPEFSKLRLFGYPLHKDIRIFIRKRGKWLQIAPRSVRQEKYMLEFDCGQTQRTIRIRIEFPMLEAGRPLELYEIEMENPARH